MKHISYIGAAPLLDVLEEAELDTQGHISESHENDAHPEQQTRSYKRTQRKWVWDFRVM